MMSLSIGISLQEASSSDGELLLKQADFAMYSAKEKGKNNYQFFNEDLSKKITRKYQLEYALRKAIERHELQLYFQPQIELRTGTLVGLEALIRWNSPFGIISPIEFIPIAEETGLILPLGEWVIQEACRQIKEWEREGRPKVKVSVNASAKQFQDPEFSNKVKRILQGEKVDSRYFEIEITESVMMDIEKSKQRINELQEFGVKIAIDDFGAGYSSLNVIKNIEIDTLKIDKSLINEVLSNQRNLFILTAIIEAGKNLNTQIVVEGIESEEQVTVLKEFDVIGQGYLFSRPLQKEELELIWKKEERIPLKAN